MTQQGALAVMIAVAVVLIGLGVWAWWRRTKRDSSPLIQPGELPASATILATFETLYVATTKHDTPLERIAAPGLAMRSRATVTVTDAAVAIDHRVIESADHSLVGRTATVADEVTRWLTSTLCD